MLKREITCNKLPILGAILLPMPTAVFQSLCNSQMWDRITASLCCPASYAMNCKAAYRIDDLENCKRGFI
jgi:hypothetical protein